MSQNLLQLLTNAFDSSKINLIDIGAAGGLEPRWEVIKNNVNVIGFEPDPKEFQKLSNNYQITFKYINKALSDKEEELTIYLTKKQQCSSIYKPNMELISCFQNPERFDVIRKTTAIADTLDNCLSEDEKS